MKENKNDELNPLDYLSEEELEAVEIYGEKLLEDMEEAGIDDDKKQEYYEISKRYATYSEAANSLDLECTEISNKCKELKELYLKEENVEKANKLAEEYNKNEHKYQELMEKKDYFEDKCEEMQDKIEMIDKEINNKIKDKERENEVKRRQ